MKFTKFLIVISLLISFHVAPAQVNRYMVFFSDKDNTPYSISQPAEFLSPKAIARRANQNILITGTDLPVDPVYCQQIESLGVSVYYKTRWLNGVLVQCKSSKLASILALSFVTSVEMVAPDSLLSKEGRLKSESVSDSKTSTMTVATDTQLHMIGIDKMHSNGFHGEGITIAVIDAGFPGVDTKQPFQNLITEGRINEDVSYDFVLNSKNVFKQNNHGTKVLSAIGGFNDSQFFGAAYKANFQLYITEYDPSEYKIEEYNWLFAAERADSAGADIISTSLGYNTFDDTSMDYTRADMDGKTTIISRAAQFVSDRGVLVVCSAGNEGSNSWQIITAPADVEDVLSIANVTAQGVKSSTSSVGPTADNRIKPDLAALGTNVAVVGPDGSIGSGSGTSFSAPLVAGLAAGLWQQFPYLTNHELISFLKRTASQFNNPDNEIGFGIPNYVAVSNYIQYINQTNTFEVSPNPFSGTLNIRPKNPEDIPSCQFQLITVQGALIRQSAIEFNWLNPSFDFSTSQLPSGLYILRITWNNKNYTFKVVKE